MAVVAAIGVGAYFVFGSGGDVKPYKIALPESLLSGEFHKATGAGSGSEEDLRNDKTTKALGITDAKGVSGAYENTAKLKVHVSGAYGKVANPETAVDQMFAQVEKSQQEALGSRQAKLETVTPVTKYSPSGFDGTVLKCKTLKVSASAGGMTMSSDVSVCIWGDNSALGVVQAVPAAPSPTGGTATQAPGAKDLAEKTAKIRSEVRQEIK